MITHAQSYHGCYAGFCRLGLTLVYANENEKRVEETAKKEDDNPIRSLRQHHASHRLSLPPIHLPNLDAQKATPEEQSSPKLSLSNSV